MSRLSGSLIAIAKHEKKKKSVRGWRDKPLCSRCEVTAIVVYWGPVLYCTCTVSGVSRLDDGRFSQTSGNDGGVATPLAVTIPRGCAIGCPPSHHCGIKTCAPPSPINSVRRVFRLTDVIHLFLVLDKFQTIGTMDYD
jgi:hypothetical protein